MKQRSKIPSFSSEKEEFNFWSTHESTEYFGDTEEIKGALTIGKRKRPKKRITMLLDQRLKITLEKIAEEKGIPYQTLIQMWLREKVNQEIKRKLAS